jgi:hypothetical protein
LLSILVEKNWYCSHVVGLNDFNFSSAYCALALIF